MYTNKIFTDETLLMQLDEDWEECELMEVEEAGEALELVDSWTQVSERDLDLYNRKISLITSARSTLETVAEESESTTVSGTLLYLYITNLPKMYT